MKLAAIESSGLVASVALWSDDVLLAEYSTNDKKTHSQTLLPMLAQIIGQTGIKPEELDAIAISAGPGSFTGLRIGSATAKGLGLALDIPLIEVSSLEAMAYQICGFSGVICPMMDARRGQVYTALYCFEDDGTFTRLSDEQAIPAAEAVEKVNELGRPVMYLGDGVPVYEEVLREMTKVKYDFAPPFASRQRAGAVACLGAKYFKEGKSIQADMHAPRYLRLSQAERERLEKEKASC